MEDDGPSSIIERIHDPKIQRRIMVDELSTHLVESIESLNGMRSISVEQLKDLQRTLEFQILRFCQTRGWTERELPLAVHLEMNGTVPFMNLTGPLAYEVAEGIVKFTSVGNQVRSLSSQWEDIIDEQEELAYAAPKGSFDYDV